MPLVHVNVPKGRREGYEPTGKSRQKLHPVLNPPLTQSSPPPTFPLSPRHCPQVNPEEASSLLHSVFMSWLNEFVLLGYGRRLEQSDALPLHKRDDPTLQYNEFIKNYKEGGESVWAAIKTTFFRPFVTSSFMCAVSSISSLSGPILLKFLIMFVEEAQDPNSPSPPLSRGVLICFLMLVGQAFDSTLKAHSMYWGKLVGIGEKAGAKPTAMRRLTPYLSSSSLRASTPRP